MIRASRERADLRRAHGTAYDRRIPLPGWSIVRGLRVPPPGRSIARGVRVLLVAAALTVATSGCDALALISDGAYRNAVADGATARLAPLGHHLTERPVCGVREVPRRMDVRCTGLTTRGLPVVVTGVVHRPDSGRPHERYAIAVDGRVLLRTSCLGPGCARD